jgi:hypothetical protein
MHINWVRKTVKKYQNLYIRWWWGKRHHGNKYIFFIHNIQSTLIVDWYTVIISSWKKKDKIQEKGKVFGKET